MGARNGGGEVAARSERGRGEALWEARPHTHTCTPQTRACRPVISAARALYQQTRRPMQAEAAKETTPPSEMVISVSV